MEKEDSNMTLGQKIVYLEDKCVFLQQEIELLKIRNDRYNRQYVRDQERIKHLKDMIGVTGEKKVEVGIEVEKKIKEKVIRKEQKKHVMLESSQRLLLYQNHCAGLSVQDLVKKYGVSRATVQNIIRDQKEKSRGLKLVLP